MIEKDPSMLLQLHSPPQQREEVQDVRKTRAVHQARRNPRDTLKGRFLEITFVSTVFYLFLYLCSFIVIANFSIINISSLILLTSAIANVRLFCCVFFPDI